MTRATAAGSSGGTVWWSTTIVSMPRERAWSTSRDGAGAAVGGDDEGDALGGEGVDGGGVDAVAFGEAVRQVGNGRREMGDAGQFAEAFDEDGGGGDAVDVEVAVDGDGLAGADRRVGCARWRADVGEEQRVVVDGGAAEEGGGLVGGTHAAVVEEVADERWVWRAGEGVVGEAAAQAPAARGGAQRCRRRSELASREICHRFGTDCRRVAVQRRGGSGTSCGQLRLTSRTIIER